jgi:ParB family chromosome partitioning protein
MPKVESRPVGWIKPDPSQPRKLFEEAALIRLGESLKIRQNDPLQVMSDGTLIDGERRWRAAQLAGIEKLLVIIHDQPLTPAQLATIRLTGFFHRVDLTPVEKSQAVADCLAQNPDWDQSRAAKEFQVDPGMITRLLSPWKCIPEAQEAYRNGQITTEHCFKMSSLSHEDQAEFLRLRLAGASATELKEFASSKPKPRGGSKPKPPAERIPRVRIQMAINEDKLTANGTVTVAGLAGEEIDLEGVENLLRGALRLVRDAKKENWGVKAAQAAWRDTATAGA